MNIKRGIFYIIIIFTPCLLEGQKYLQIEKFGSPYTQKIPIGSSIEYKLKGDDFFSIREIRDLDIDNNLIVLSDRYIDPNKIEAFRYSRGWPKAMGNTLIFFGAGWSGFALVGTATDDNPDTNYRTSDAIVTGASIGIGFLLSKLFKQKTLRFGKRNRIRLLDITFTPVK